MRRAGAALALTLAAPAGAQVTAEPVAEARLRYEHDTQGGLPRDADAVTARVRSGVRLTDGGWSALVEAEGTLAIVPAYFDGVRGDRGRPQVNDPETVELYRAQLRYATPRAGVTAGRQVVELLDQRFVGSSQFRDNGQVFDAVRGTWRRARLSLDLTYAWRDHTTAGAFGEGARPGSIRGDDVFAVASYAAPGATLSGFAVLVGEDTAAAQGFRLNSQTYGVRLAGARALGRWRLGYAASWARQAARAPNPNRYAASYWLGEASLTRHVVAATLGYEVLGADRGAALTSVQTPFATLFRFNGWADKFTTTPPDGLRDAYLTGVATWPLARRGDTLSLTASAHRFESDRLMRRYGDELDLLAAWKRGRFTWSLRFAGYRPDRFATDTRKAWASMDWGL